MLPKARQENLTVQQLPSEVLVHDLKSRKTHCLNLTAALVWRHCDGATSLSTLGSIVRDQLQIADPDPVVRLALEQLSRRGLLEQPVTPLTDAARASRRAVLKKLVTAAVVLPLVMTINGADTVGRFTSNKNETAIALPVAQQPVSCFNDKDCPAGQACNGVGQQTVVQNGRAWTFPTPGICG